MARPDYLRRARDLEIEREFSAICALRKGEGLLDESHLLDLPPRLRFALHLVEGAPDLVAATNRLRKAIEALGSNDDRVLALVSWNLDDSRTSAIDRGLQWLDRLDELARRGLTRWTNSDTLRKESLRVAFRVCRWLIDTIDDDQDIDLRDGDTRDPYSLFAAGVMAYARVLHLDERDPALLRLRSATSLTLHVLGFHEQRVELGRWAEQAARYVNDCRTLLSVLIDDLGWANYLLGEDAGAKNIKRALVEGEAVPADERDDEWALLMAKAHRHLGVIESERTGQPADLHFESARTFVDLVSPAGLNQAMVDRAHIHHARALALVTIASRTEDGSSDPAAPQSAEEILRQALDEVRLGIDGFRRAGDQGRTAKSLVLEVQILHDLNEHDEAKALEAVRDRALSESVWARPAGRRYIAGRARPRYDWNKNG